MGIITEVTVPGEDFELGDSLAALENVHVTFERVVPSGDRLFPYMWVRTADHTLFRQLLVENDAVASVEVVHREDDRALYDMGWETDTAGFLACLRETDPIVLRAGGSPTAWEFELRFEDQGDIGTFQQECSQNDISISVDRVITKSVANPPLEKLTESQRNTVQLALDKGYFDVPRKTTLVELAEELGVSDQAVSARIRRAMKKLSQQLLLPSNAEEQEVQQANQR
jgi:predicted DNA binding protein